MQFSGFSYIHKVGPHSPRQQVSCYLIVSVWALKEVVFEGGKDSADKIQLEVTFNFILVEGPFLKSVIFKFYFKCK